MIPMAIGPMDPLATGVPATQADSQDVAQFAVVGVPEGCTGWKVRHGPDRFSTIYLRYEDGIDERALVYGEQPRTLTPASDLLLRSTRRGSGDGTASASRSTSPGEVLGELTHV